MFDQKYLPTFNNLLISAREKLDRVNTHNLVPSDSISRSVHYDFVRRYLGAATLLIEFTTRYKSQLNEEIAEYALETHDRKTNPVLESE